MSTAGSTIFQSPMQKSIYDIDQNNIVDQAEVAVPSAHTIALHSDMDQGVAKADSVIFARVTLGDDETLDLGSVTMSGQSNYNHNFVDGDIDIGNDTITENGHGFSNGDIVRLTTTGVLPAGLALNIDYYIISATVNNYKLSLTKGGGAVNITGAAGGGTHTSTLQLVLTINNSISIPNNKKLYCGNNNKVSIGYDAVGGWGEIIIDNTGAFYLMDVSNGKGMGLDVATGANMWNGTITLNLLPTGVAFKQSSGTGAVPTVIIEQVDVSEGLINFIGSDRGIIAGATASVGSIRVELSGTVYRLALYANA